MIWTHSEDLSPTYRAVPEIKIFSNSSKIKYVASRNKVTVVTKDKPTLKAVKENDTKKPAMTDDELMKKIKSSLTFQVSGGKKGIPGLQEGPMDKRIAVVFLKLTYRFNIW